MGIRNASCISSGISYNFSSLSFHCFAIVMILIVIELFYSSPDGFFLIPDFADCTAVGVGQPGTEAHRVHTLGKERCSIGEPRDRDLE